MPTGKKARVPSYTARQSTTIEATPQACFDAMLDYDRLPEWQSSIKSLEVLERDEQGRGSLVEYILDAKVRTVRYTLRLVYEEPHSISCEYVEGDFRNLSAQWRFHDAGDGRTTAGLELELDPGRFVPGPVRSRIQEYVMSRSVRELKVHLEGRR